MISHLVMGREIRRLDEWRASTVAWRRFRYDLLLACLVAFLVADGAHGASAARTNRVALGRGRDTRLLVAPTSGSRCLTVFRVPRAGAHATLYDNGELVFAYRGTLMAVNPAGVVRRLHVGNGSVLAGVWSPDGRWVAVGGRRLSIFRAQATRPTIVVPAVHATAAYLAPAWSRNGKWIAFTAVWIERRSRVEVTPQGHVRIVPAVQAAEVQAMRRDGSALRTLYRYRGSGDAAGVVAPQWSPDSRSVAFTAPAASGAALFSVSRSGAGLRQLTHPRGASDIGPIWAPDSHHLAFSRRFIRGNDAGDAYIIAATGGGLRRLTRTGSSKASAYGSVALAFSPNGDALLLARESTLATVKVRSRQLRRVCSIPAGDVAADGAWLP